MMMMNAVSFHVNRVPSEAFTLVTPESLCMYVCVCVCVCV